MTPSELIGQWFGRHQDGVPGHMRVITVQQIDLLRKLAEQDDEFAQQSGEPSAIQPGRGRSFVWMPRGGDKYVITEAEHGRRNTIVRLANIRAGGAGTLF